MKRVLGQRLCLCRMGCSRRFLLRRLAWHAERLLVCRFQPRQDAIVSLAFLGLRFVALGVS
jgi:hypothetical protein